MDFTYKVYSLLLNTLSSKKFSFFKLSNYFNLINSNQFNNKSLILLRHDVDRSPSNSLQTAIIENELGIEGSYYFRIIHKVFDEKIINRIADLGHEIGYHYEDVDLTRKKLKIKSKKLSQDELIDLAYEGFCTNLERMRKLYPITTICAHGSPLSPYDNKIIWEKYDYKKLGIIGDPSFDMDWNKFAYFTDTGRRWNGKNVSVRDKVKSQYNFNFKSTFDIINNSNKLPSHLMITVHPQRWNDNNLYWTKELIMQSVKNVIKKYYFVKN